MKSRVPFLACPSAMLEGMETAALRICATIPYISRLGNESVRLYVSLASDIPHCQTSRSR